jgi:DNA-directed RNA polymerase specialized sigma24 family protein
MPSREDALFAEIYRRYYRSIRHFCRRRVANDLVDDAVAETFLIAWRRLEDVPAGDEALIWLYGVAYRVIGHQWQSTARRRRLEDRLRAVARRPASAADESVIDGDEYRLVLDAAARLSHTDADISPLPMSVGAMGQEGGRDEFRLLVSWLDAQGYKQILDTRPQW